MSIMATAAKAPRNTTTPAERAQARVDVIRRRMDKLEAKIDTNADERRELNAALAEARARYRHALKRALGLSVRLGDELDAVEAYLADEPDTREADGPTAP